MDSARFSPRAFIDDLLRAEATGDAAEVQLRLSPARFTQSPTAESLCSRAEVLAPAVASSTPPSVQPAPESQLRLLAEGHRPVSPAAKSRSDLQDMDISFAGVKNPPSPSPAQTGNPLLDPTSSSSAPTISSSNAPQDGASVIEVPSSSLRELFSQSALSQENSDNFWEMEEDSTSVRQNAHCTRSTASLSTASLQENPSASHHPLGKATLGATISENGSLHNRSFADSPPIRSSSPPLSCDENSSPTSQLQVYDELASSRHPEAQPKATPFRLDEQPEEDPLPVVRTLSPDTVQRIRSKAKALRAAIDAQHASMLQKANTSLSPIRVVEKAPKRDPDELIYDDMLPEAFVFSSSEVRRYLDEKIELVLHLDSLCKKVSIAASSSLESPVDLSEASIAIASADAVDEIRRLRSQLQGAEALREENEHLKRRLNIQAARMKSAVEESETLVKSLRLALDKEEFKRLRVQAQYDEEKTILKTSFEKVITELSTEIASLKQKDTVGEDTV